MNSMTKLLLLAGGFPKIDAPNEVCERYATLACSSLSADMLGRLLRRQGAILWVTHYTDGTITAEASDIYEEAEFAAELTTLPTLGEVLVVLAYADIRWGSGASCDRKMSFWRGMLRPKNLTI